MNIIEMYETIKRIYDENKDEYEVIGLRFENKDREIGEICEYSRHNPDRNDERDFPEYGTKDYEGLEELDGTSAWSLRGYDYRIDPWQNTEVDCRNHFLQAHCYIIAGNERGTHDDPDEGEVLIRDAVVIAKIF